MIGREGDIIVHVIEKFTDNSICLSVPLFDNFLFFFFVPQFYFVVQKTFKSKERRKIYVDLGTISAY